MWIIALVIVGVVLLAAVVWLITTFNRLITLWNRFKNGYSQIDVQLKRRHDLIPNLVETVKGYMAHERQTLEAVIAARNEAVSAGAAGELGVTAGLGGAALAIPTVAQMAHIAGAEGQLGGALHAFIGRVEAYPDLKADGTVRRLMEELSTTENRISFARQGYNDSAMVYNTSRESFPTNVVAPMFGFAEAGLWQIDDARERENVTVKLSP